MLLRCLSGHACSRMCSHDGFDATIEQQNLVISHFFAESNIVHTLQHLLSHTAQNVEDLCKLCVAASEDSVVMALNVHGLMPFANHPEFVYPYSCMSIEQLQALKGHCVSALAGIACPLGICNYGDRIDCKKRKR